MDFENRFEHGELFNKDSIKFNEKLKFKTLGGRVVYGGGGIMPDVFVPFDTAFSSKYLNQLYFKNILREYALNYANENKTKLTEMGLNKFMETWTMTPAQEKDIIALATKEGVEYNDAQYKRSRATILNAMKAFVARSIWREEGSYRVIHQQDEIFQKALELWNEANALTASKK
ncbi:MAG: peptidase S41, partial [Flexibacteraceae bacterium]